MRMCCRDTKRSFIRIMTLRCMVFALQALLVIGVWNDAAGSSLLQRDPALRGVSILTPAQNGSYMTLHHKKLFAAIRKHPLFEKDPRHARFVLVDVDTFMQNLWDKGRNDGQDVCCAPESVECNHCYPDIPKIYINALETHTAQHPHIAKQQTFVYLRDSHHLWNTDSEDALPRLRERMSEFNMLFLGFDLTKDEALPGEFNVLPAIMEKFMPANWEAMDDCTPRKFKACFIGNMETYSKNSIRSILFNATKDEENFFMKESGKWNLDLEGYKKVLDQCDMGFAPRGDNHYSFRLTESLSRGTVPILIDDLMVDVYGIAPSEWLVKLPEGDLEDTAKIINAISQEQICDLRKRGKKVLKWSDSISGVADGIVRSLIDRTRALN